MQKSKRKINKAEGAPKKPRRIRIVNDITLRPSGKGFICNQTGEKMKASRAKKFVISKNRELNPPKPKLSETIPAVPQKTARKIKDFPSAFAYSASGGHAVCCPHCDTENLYVTPGKIITCYDCRKKFLIKSKPALRQNIDSDGDFMCKNCGHYNYVGCPGYSQVSERTAVCKRCKTPHVIYRHSRYSFL